VEALESLKSKPVGLILPDINVPNVDNSVDEDVLGPVRLGIPMIPDTVSI
jgi:hypothetical protein